MLRVLQVSDLYPPSPGGLEAHVERLAQQLIARGHDVSVLACGSTPDTQRRDGVRVDRDLLSLSRLPVAFAQPERPFHPPWPDRTFTKAIQRAIVRTRPDVVHAHGWSVFSAAQAAARSGTPVVSTLHDYGLQCPKKTLIRRGAVCVSGRGMACMTCDSDTQPTVRRTGLATALSRSVPWLTRHVDRFVAVSAYVADRHREAGVPDDRLTVISNFVDDDRPAAGEALALPDRYVLYAGGVQQHKGYAVLRAAQRALSADGIAVVVAGATTGAENGSSANLLHVGLLRGEDMQAAYRDAALVVCPSIWPEPCPTVALEAMAWGRPVVASAIGGLPDIVEHGETGLLVEPGDPGDLAGAVRGLMCDAARQARFAGNALERVREFRADRIVGRMQEVYEDAARA